MTLTVDVGNSHTVVGLWQESNLAQVLRLRSDPRRTADEWRILLTAWLREYAADRKVSYACFCSVVPAASSALGEAVSAMGIAEPLWLSSESKLNFKFDYPQPQTLGADRLADLIAGSHFFGGDVIVVDFGTAITFSVLAGGVFLGGVIAPGITSSLDALFSSTAKLPRITFRHAARGIGKSTGESIEIGAYVGWRGMVNEILGEIRRDLPGRGANHKVIATGGISESLDFAPGVFDVVDRNLTLKGLYQALVLTGVK